jgi:truncated hemoglobin YjbI
MLPDPKSLFQNLTRHFGDEEKAREAVVKILRDFYLRMSKDLLIGFFFAGKKIEAIADKQAEFLLRAMGARASYSGKAPADAHTELPPILSGHFDRRLRILEETLTAHDVPKPEVESWVAFEEAFRDRIVKKS